jgi:1,4-dihydroxy-2-naphthoyl-CoA hydrolase
MRKMFVAYNQVRMHDTDMAGILYFPRIFRFAHDALEDFVATLGYTFDQVFHRENFVFVIVHAEADYLAPLTVGDKLEVHVKVERIGETSFTVIYHIYKSDKTLAGTAKTVHVTLDSSSRVKMPIPPAFRQVLTEHLQPE